MYTLIMIVHIFVCLFLIFVILLQAGRGGGFSDMMGGGQPQSILGTQTNAFMTRVTEVCAVLFIVTSLTLTLISINQGKSLMERERQRDMLKRSPIATSPAAVPAAATTDAAQPTEGNAR